MSGRLNVLCEKQRNVNKFINQMKNLFYVALIGLMLLCQVSVKKMKEL
jgi:hypothetical protein